MVLTLYFLFVMVAAIGLPFWLGWSGTVFVLGALAVGLAGWSVSGLVRGGRPRFEDVRSRAWILPLLLLFAFMGLQSLNPSHVYVASTGTLVPVTHWAWLPQTVDAGATRMAVLLLIGYALAFWLAREVSVHRHAIMFFMISQVACGALMALEVLAQRTQAPGGAFYPLTGLFVSPNQYAAYANLLLPVCLALARHFQVSAERRMASSHPGYLFLFLSILLELSIFLSGSRAGILVSFIMIGGFLLVEWVAFPVNKRFEIGLGVLVLLGVGVVASLMVDPGIVQKLIAWWKVALGGVEVNVLTRWEALGGVIQLFQDRWVAGSGVGTFAEVFPYYQSPEVAGFFRHAHNEYLQILAEFGVIGSLLLGSSLVLMWVFPANRRHAGFELGRRGRASLLLALGGLALHSLVDFPLRAPVIGFLAAAFMGVGGGWSFRRKADDQEAS